MEKLMRPINKIGQIGEANISIVKTFCFPIKLSMFFSFLPMQMPSDNDEQSSAEMQKLEKQLADLKKEAADARKGKAPAKGGTNETLDRLLGPERGD